MLAVASPRQPRVDARSRCGDHGVDLGQQYPLQVQAPRRFVSVGALRQVRGSFTLSDDVASSSVEITVDASVDSNDENRDKHLRFKDFFDAKQFPEMSFKSTKLRPKATLSSPSPEISPCTG